MPLIEGPYAALLLKEVFEDPVPGEGLHLPLTLAYLLSARIHFLLPVGEDSSRLIDAAFDEILKGLNRFSLESKGVFYAKDCGPDQITEILAGADLIVTTDVGVELSAREKGLPCVCLPQGQGERPVARISYLERVKDEEMRRQLVGCAQLINLLSGGFISKGHFSLSW